MSINIQGLKDRFDRKGSEKPDRLTLKDGDNYIRILPPSLEALTGDVDYMSMDYLMHFNLGPEKNKASICARSFNKKAKCPICETVWQMKDHSKDPGDKELSDKIKAKIRHLFNVVDLNEKEKGIQVLEVGPLLYREIMVYMTNPNYKDLLDVESGHNITLTKRNQKSTASGFVEYGFVPDPQKTSILPSLPANWKDAVDSLKGKVPPSKTYDELKAILYGEDEDVDAVEVVSAVSAPVPAQPTQPKAKVTVGFAPAVVAETAAAPVVEAPACFGTDTYGPKRPECVPCKSRRDCVIAFVG